MNKPWVGFLASGLIFLAGLLELVAGQTGLGVFLLIMAIISLVLRIYFVKKLREGEKNEK